MEKQKINSLEILTNSIKYDFKVFRWFQFLITQKGVTANNDPLKNTYKNCALIQILSLPLILYSLIVTVTNSNYLYLAISAPLVILSGITHFKERKIIANIGEKILFEEFTEEELSANTLYQISEKLGKKYNIPSLVDIIYNEDRIIRRVIILAFITSCLIFQLNVFKILLSLFLSFVAVSLILNISFVYKRLK